MPGDRSWLVVPPPMSSGKAEEEEPPGQGDAAAWPLTAEALSRQDGAQLGMASQVQSCRSCPRCVPTTPECR